MKKLIFIKKRFSIYGGGENYMKTLIDRLRADHEITVFSNKWTAADGIGFEHIPISSSGSFLSTATFNRNVCKRVERAKADCTISFERTTCQDIYRAGEGCHAEWLEIRSRTEPLFKRLSFKANPLHILLLNLERDFFSNTKHIVANSKMVKDHIIKHYAVPGERIAVIYNGVDLLRFTPENKERWKEEVRESLSVPKDAKLLLFVGSGFKRKGLKTLIESIPFMRRSDTRVLVIGKGDSSAYRSLAEQHNAGDRIIFLEPRKDIERLYAAADLFVLPTLYDPFSNATLEAMAAGVPVVTSGNNGVAELVEDGREGFIINDPLDTKGLAEKAALCLDNTASMGAKAREKAEGFSIERAASAFAETVKQVTDLKGAA